MHFKTGLAAAGVAALWLGAMLQPLGAETPVAPPAWPFPHEGSDVAPDPGIVWGRLPNGVGYVLWPHAEPPGRLSLRLFVGAGSLEEDDDEQGLAHFLEHMAFNGTRRFPAGDMVEYFQRLGMGFGADTNASTSFNRTIYQLELPRTDDTLLAESMQLLRDYVDGMLLADMEIERERGVVLSEMRARDSVAYRQVKSEIRNLFPETRIPYRMPIGIEEVLRTAPPERFRQFYARWYRPSTTVVVAVGDVSVARLEALVAENFGDWVEPAEPPPWPEMGPIGVTGWRIGIHADAEAPALTVAIQMPLEQDPHVSSAGMRQRLYRSLATQALNRRLQILAREESSPFANATAYSYLYFPTVRVSGLRLTGRPERWTEVLAATERELRRSLEHGFTEAELAEAVARRRNALEVAVRGKETRKARDLADSLAESLVDGDIYTSPEQDLAMFEAAVAELTPEVVVDAWRAVWPDNGRVVFVAGALGPDVTEAAVQAVLDESLATPVEPPVAAGVTEFAYTSFGEPGTLVRRRDDAEFALTTLEFANGVRATLKPLPVERDRILIELRFGRGGLTMADRPGLGLYAGTAFDVGGLGQHSYDEIQRLLAGKTVGIDFSVGSEAFTLTSDTTLRDAGMALNVLTAYLTDPGYRPEARTVLEKNVERFYLRLRRTWQGVFGNEVRRFLAGGDPRFGQPPQAAVLELTTEEVAAWLAPALTRDALEVTVVGDFELEAMVAELARTVGALPARSAVPEPMEELRQVRFPAEAGGTVQRFGFESELDQSFVGVFWSTTDDSDPVRDIQLDLLASVLEDRLRKVIREEAGDTYSPFAVSQTARAYRGYGFLFGGIIAEPAKAEALAQTVREVAADAAAGGITEDELVRAREPYRTSREEAERSLGTWLAGLSGSAWDPDRRRRLVRWREIVAGVTVADLQALASEYLTAERGVAVLILPVKTEDGAQPAPEAASPEN